MLPSVSSRTYTAWWGGSWAPMPWTTTLQCWSHFIWRKDFKWWPLCWANTRCLWTYSHSIVWIAWFQSPECSLKSQRCYNYLRWTQYTESQFCVSFFLSQVSCCPLSALCNTRLCNVLWTIYSMLLLCVKGLEWLKILWRGVRTVHSLPSGAASLPLTGYYIWCDACVNIL